ncbi:hypothetical protein WH50_03400 [Pokkaliibacter plantistimulans]|uniref:Uncharacterized protein n=1 Tax=Pokkaliibacter plantistimulans TaxID=1635171 RepID=A0ABX5M141_9GAMM|nr:hypothetical protein [Pokkaliibacter plantistimulans]PXF32636.1 hypothetical protein WH50_03400 [Pokkaliibacter plantistimulans]
MKYIMLGVPMGQGLRHFPIIFPDVFSHDQMAEAAQLLPGLANSEVVSAGLCNIDVTCYGDSPSLQRASRSVDTRIINTYSLLHGFADLADLPPSLQSLCEPHGHLVPHQEPHHD